MKQQVLSVGVIGCGNCGGQIADLASSEGFDAVAINASKDDLEQLVNKVECFLVGDGNGTGKDRDLAKEFLHQYSNIIKDEKLVAFVLNHDVIVIYASTGGGFGSGSQLELTSILSQIYQDKLFIPAGVLPFNDEGYTAHNHSIGWEQDLEAMSIPYMMYDNEKYSGRPENEVCELVNENIISDLKIMRGDYIYNTKTGGIDPRDLLTTLSAPGRIVMGAIVGIDVEDVVDKSLIATLKKTIDENTAHADLVDDKQILASATMYCLPEEFDLFKGTIRGDLQKTYGEHITDYTNFVDITETSNTDIEPCVAIILAGLTAPNTRIGRIVKRYEKLAAGIGGRKTPESKVQGINTSEGANKLKLGAKSFGGTRPGTKVNVDQVLSRFNNAAASASQGAEKTTNTPVEK